MNIHVIDPVCAQVKGHNLQALKNHIQFFSRTQQTIDCYAHGSERLNLTCSERNRIGICTNFTYLYDDVLDISKEDGTSGNVTIFPFDTPIDPQCAISHPYIQEIKERHLENQAKALCDFKAFFEKYKIGYDSFLFLPSCDYYSAKALLNIISDLSPQITPSICFRFINVMEYWTTLDTNPIQSILSNAKELMEKGHRLYIAAEAIGYCYELEREFDLTVTHLPYIPHFNAQQTHISGQQERSCYTVLFPGSQRDDKGMTRIPEIVAHSTLKIGVDQIQFILQLPSSHEIKKAIPTYQELSKYPNVIVQESSISETQLKENYESCDLICLPYSIGTYGFKRSSGSLVEAVLYAKPIVSTKCEGFIKEIDFFSLGKYAETNEELAELIFFYYQADKLEIKKKMRSSVNRYFSFLEGAYSRLIREVLEA
jgi:hypothetical protein